MEHQLPLVLDQPHAVEVMGDFDPFDPAQAGEEVLPDGNRGLRTPDVANAPLAAPGGAQDGGDLAPQVEDRGEAHVGQMRPLGRQVVEELVGRQQHRIGARNDDQDGRIMVAVPAAEKAQIPVHAAGPAEGAALGIDDEAGQFLSRQEVLDLAEAGFEDGGVDRQH